MAATNPSVFTFLDYRAFLKAVFDFNKANTASFSFRRFSRDAGFASPNFLKLVYDGERNLTAESALKVAKAFKLNKVETDFFANLVQFTQATTAADKNNFYEKMNRSRHFREIKAIEREQFDYYNQWHHIAIRELVETKDFKEDNDWIAGRIRKDLDVNQVADALKLLLDLGLLARDSKGDLRQVDANISTAAEVRSLAIANYHRQMLAMASQSIEQIDPLARDITSSTFAIAASQMPELKKRVDHFRRSIITWLSASKEPKEQIYQMGVQIFPLTELPASFKGDS